jgi:hypothetical protein
MEAQGFYHGGDEYKIRVQYRWNESFWGDRQHT